MKKLVSLLIGILIILNTTLVVSAASISDNDAARVKEVMELIQKNYRDSLTSKEVADDAIKGLLRSLDSHSVYFTEAEYIDFVKSIDGNFSGIGVQIKKDGDYIEIVDVIKNSPSEKAGLKPGYKFDSVDGVSVKGIETDVFVSKVRGPKDSKVKVGILRGEETSPIYYELTRDDIVLPEVNYKILDGNIGYIQLTEFGTAAAEEFQKSIDYMNKNKIEKIIFDLRGNPGGYLDQAVKIAETFVPKGPIISVVESGNRKMTYFSKNKNMNFRLVVLINGGSASASEIVAGAIQDTKSGIIVGTKSFGKGTVQKMFELSDGSYAKLTIAKYLTPKGRFFEGDGMVPDVVVENSKVEHLNSMFEKIQPFRTIRLGNRGKDVLAVEQRLDYLGYDVGSPDYTFDAKTSRAFMKFLKDNKLTGFAAINEETQKLIDEKATDVSKSDRQLEKAIEILSQD